MLRILLLLAVIGMVLYQFPGVVNEVAEVAGMSDGSACDAVENYFSYIGDGTISKASEYKFAGESFPPWTDDVDAVDSVTCTCAEDLSDKHIEQVDDLPASLTNITDMQFVTYDMNATYQGGQAAITGGAIVFQLASPGRFITNERIYDLDGQQVNQPEFGLILQKCGP